ncbi:hypothetical protein TNCT_57991 [Trichonephila clavata]|uniref:Uncharacterized protein n=1 Tax=Trichonephila clavata TaxID=2740835 RepID=A0A8X6FNF7_TRICU|nr:hypothetical protein TNCT_57991 [Trichonephila clavata]
MCSEKKIPPSSFLYIPKPARRSTLLRNSEVRDSFTCIKKRVSRQKCFWSLEHTTVNNIEMVCFHQLKTHPFYIAITLCILHVCSNNAGEPNQRLSDMVFICNGHDLMKAIQRACVIYRKKRSEPLKLPLARVAELCCSKPCRMSLFVLLCA